MRRVLHCRGEHTPANWWFGQVRKWVSRSIYPNQRVTRSLLHRRHNEGDTCTSGRKKSKPPIRGDVAHSKPTFTHEEGKGVQGQPGLVASRDSGCVSVAFAAIPSRSEAGRLFMGLGSLKGYSLMTC